VAFTNRNSLTWMLPGKDGCGVAGVFGGIIDGLGGAPGVGAGVEGRTGGVSSWGFKLWPRHGAMEIVVMRPPRLAVAKNFINS
jgi:hypothetical protein